MASFVKPTSGIEKAELEIMTNDATRFVIDLAARFGDRVNDLLEARNRRQATFDEGQRPDFLADTKSVRDGDWKVASLPHDLQDRRVEITGPVDRKMIINALNSGANVFMADFEDSSAPSWTNMLQGQLNLRDAIRGTISFTSDRNKKYALADNPAVLMVRPRGWHLKEEHFLANGKTVSASLFDFGLYFFHNAKALVAKGSGPYFYLPKIQSHLEARLWNDVFCYAQQRLNIPKSTIKATVLIETLPAAFEMDEILYELREHSAGLNCGRWDYIFSFIKTFRNDPNFVTPDRGLVGMTQPFMRAYTQLLIKTCHRRGVHAMGGMAAQIPIKNNDERNAAAMDKVRVDKLREVQDGHDGTWVAHPGLIPLAKEIFDIHMPQPNQIENKREDVNVTAEQLIEVPAGERTVANVRHCLRVAVQYLEAWLSGSGCVPLYNLMEDAATAEISRMQVWQWIRHSVELDDGQTLTAQRFRSLLNEEMKQIQSEVGELRFKTGNFSRAKNLFEDLTANESCEDFLTIPAYQELITQTKENKNV